MVQAVGEKSLRSTGNDKLIEWIEYVPIASLKPYANHARRHSPEKIKRLRDNINEFGFLVPLLIDAEGVLIAGHARLAAAIDLGFKRVSILRITHLTDAQVKALRIADNKLTEMAEWDASSLALEFEAIIEGGLDLDLTGFSIPEIDLVFAGINESVADNELDEVAPIHRPPTTRLGDTWIMGRHRVVCDSALDSASFSRLMSTNRAAMVLSDPPYNVPIDGHVSGNGALRHREFAMASGEMSEHEFQEFLQRAIANSIEASHLSAPLFLFMDWRGAPHLHRAAVQLGLEQINLCVWVKSNAGMGSLYRSQHELVMVFARRGAKLRNNVELGRHGRNRSNVWYHAGANALGGETRAAFEDHPTPKPVQLLADAILDVTKQSDLVLDMFLGGGATLIACERTKRICRGIEIDPQYVDVVVRRWERETGVQACLKETGETFDQVTRRRRETLLSADREKWS